MPTFSRKRSRSSISRRMSRAMWRSVSVSSHLVEPAQRRDDRQPHELVDPQPADEHRARLRPQPRALARRARPHAHVLLDLLARELRVRLAVAALEVGDDPLEARLVGALAPVAVAVGDVDGLAVRAEQEAGRGAPRTSACPGRLEVRPVALGDRLHDLLVVARRAVRPRRERALGDRQRRVGHDELGVDLALRPSPVQRSHAPCGELNEKIRGSSSGIDVPHFRHAKRSENCSISPGAPSRGSSSISMIPSASATAVSTESTSRLRTSWRSTSRSTTTEMSCLNFLSSSIGSSSSSSSPSTFTRA